MNISRSNNNAIAHFFFWVACLCLFFIFSPMILYAAPTIQSVSGTIVDGEQIIVSGSSFGTNGPTVILFDDFEDGSANSPISLTSPKIGFWTSTKIAAKANYWNADKVSGSYSGEFVFDFNKGGSTPMQYGNLLHYYPEGYNQFFLSAWVKVPSGHYFPGCNTQCNWKLFWVDATNDWGGGSNDLVLINAYNFNGSATTFGNSGTIVLSPSNWWNESNPHLDQDVWTRFSFWVKGDTTGGTNGNFHVWLLKRGTAITQKWNQNNVHTYNAGQGDWRYFSLNAWANAGQGSPSRPLYDDVYLAIGPYARARVEIGDNAVYTSCTNMALTTPTVWSDTHIVTTVRAGSFITGQTAYLFVFDANGSVNSQGYPVTIGGGGGNNPPNPPTGLEVLQ